MNKNTDNSTDHLVSDDKITAEGEVNSSMVEMRRAMEAARERMKRSQAVYSRPDQMPDANSGETG